MAQQRISDAFIRNWQTRYGLTRDKIEAVLLGFMARTPFAQLSASTGVPADRLNKLFTRPWNRAWVYDDELKPPKKPRRKPPEKDWSSLCPKTVDAMAKLIAHGVNEECAGAYLEVPATHFMAHWKAAVELRRKERARRMLSSIRH